MATISPTLPRRALGEWRLRTHRRLDQVYASARILSFDDSSRFITGLELVDGTLRLVKWTQSAPDRHAEDSALSRQILGTPKAIGSLTVNSLPT